MSQVTDARTGVAPPPPGAAPARARKARWWQDRRVLPYLLILPAVCFELLVHIVPMVAGVVMSFFRLTVFSIHHWQSAPFAGLGNFETGVDPYGAIGQALWHSFGVTIAYTAVVVGGSWFIGIFAATLLNAEFRGRGWLRALFLVPYALPLYVGVIVWRFMFQKDTGAINTILVNNLHILDGKPFWLLGGNAFWAMAVTSIWRWWPFAFLILLAALQNIPGQLYEAAAIDGASAWQRFRRITLPQLRSVNFVLLLVLFLWNFNDFNVPFVLFGGTPPDSANVLSLFIYVNAFDNWNFGLGSAMSVMMLAFLLVGTLVYMRAPRGGRTADA
ncbi:MAG: carbohydrate ABC transporter permease [Streptosporangiaceae bacterium]